MANTHNPNLIQVDFIPEEFALAVHQKIPVYEYMAVVLKNRGVPVESIDSDFITVSNGSAYVESLDTNGEPSKLSVYWYSDKRKLH